MPRADTSPGSPPLSPAALTELKRKAKAAIKAGGRVWYERADLSHATDWDADAEFIAACSPDVILSLLAAPRRGEDDTARIVELARTVVESGYSGGHYLGVAAAPFHALKSALAARSYTVPQPETPTDAE